MNRPGYVAPGQSVDEAYRKWNMKLVRSRKQQATSPKQQASSYKQQALLKQAPSAKLQATSTGAQSHKLADRGPLIKYRGSGIVAPD